MKTFKTKSGSTYEVDEDNKKIRRLESNHPHRSFEKDGKWRKYQALFLEKDCVCYVSWDDNETTVTSRVTEIQ